MENFESSPEFQALVVAGTGKPERSMGDSVIPAEPPLWSEVRRQARDLLSTAGNQLPLHVYLIQAETNAKGFLGLLSSFNKVLLLLREQWDDVYPKPDLDDPEDMYYERVNLINELSEQQEFLDTIYRLPLVSVRGLGDFSTRDLDISSGALAGTSEEKARCQVGLIRGAFAESDSSQLQIFSDALQELPKLWRSLEVVFAEKTGQPNVLSVDRIHDCIRLCSDRFHEFASEHLEVSSLGDTNSELEVESSTETTTLDSKVIQSTSSLSDRAMVKDSFNAILMYYQQYEPSSPVRILTARASDFVNKSFFEALQALGPGSRDDLPSLLLQLQQQPLAALLSDSFTRYLSGENLLIEQTVSELSEASQSAMPDVDGLSEDNVSSSLQIISGNSDKEAVIHSRQQVLDVLQDIEAYFTNAEPSSPIPLIVADIRKIVPKHFTDIIVEFSRLLPATATEPNE